MKTRTPSMVIMRRAVEPWFFTYTLLAFTTTGLVPILLPLELSEQGQHALQVGAVMSAIGAGMLTSPLWGTLASRYRCYRLLGSGGALAVCLAVAGIQAVQALPAWLALAFLMGCGVASAFTVSNLLILGHHPAHEVDARIGWLQTFVTLGSVGGLAVAGLMSQVPLHLGFALATLICGVATLLGTRSMRSPPAPPPEKYQEAVKHSGAIVISQHLLRSTLEQAQGEQRQRAFWLLILVWMLANLGVNALNALYPLLMRHQFQVPPSLASLALSLATGLSASLYLYASRRTHLVGGRRVLAWGLSGRVLALAILLGVGSGTTSGGLRSFTALLMMAGVTVLSPFLAVSSTIFAAQLTPDKAGGLGLYNGASAVASLAGPVLGGQLADSLGYGSVIGLALAGTALALALTLPLPAKASHD